MAELVDSGRVRQQADMMLEILVGSGRSELVLVTLAEELPTIETQETLKLLDEEKLIGSVTVVTNRILAPLETEAKGSGASATPPPCTERSINARRPGSNDYHPPETFPFIFGVLTENEVAARLSEAGAE